MARIWLDNAFWETPKKEILNAISEEQVDNKQIRQVHKLNKLNDDGTPNEMFNEVIEFLGDEVIECQPKTT